MQNIPSHAEDIRHMFRATPGYVMLSSDYSAQEPRVTAFISNEKSMIKAFQANRDVYATIASLSFNLPYERCLEHNPETGEYQADGYARRSEAKRILLGICYGRSVPSIAEQLFGKNKDMSEDEKIDSAQKIYDAVLNNFPNIRAIMIATQKKARQYGYTETILGRRRHLPDMQLPEYDFVPLDGYVNPDVDPLDPSTLKNKDAIPDRIKQALQQEFRSFKSRGKVYKRMRELHDRYHIQVVNNRSKIARATRQCLNCVSLDTEILTANGWKHYDSVSIGDKIYSYNIESNSIEFDEIINMNVFAQQTECMKWKSSAFSAISTMNHRWVVQSWDKPSRIIETERISRVGLGEYPILRVADNTFESTDSYTDDQLKFIGWVLTDGHFKLKPYRFFIYQSTRREKNNKIYSDMVSTLDRLGLKYTDRIHPNDPCYHSIYIHQCEFTMSIMEKFPLRVLTSEFIQSLSQHQAELVMQSMIECDGTIGNNHKNITCTCGDKRQADMFQYLAFIAGYATNVYERTPDVCNSQPHSDKVYDSVTNTSGIKITKPYYVVTVLRVKRAQIYKQHQTVVTEEGVWCPTTKNSTWVARHDGKVFITGNSVVQGSAADLTKLAMLELESNEEWHKLGGRMLVPVHDEIIAEVPIENWERGGQLLSDTMCEAADFLPFPSKCDVTTSIRWKGLEYPCQYPKPKSLTNLTEDEVKWVQYHLCECEYVLPVYKDENGEKPKGDASVGVNGIVSDGYLQCLAECKQELNATSDEDFIEKVENYVVNYIK